MLGPTNPRRLDQPIAVSLEDLYRADAATCNACSVKAQCTASDHGRIVHRSLCEAYLDTVRGCHATEACQKLWTLRGGCYQTTEQQADQGEELHAADHFRHAFTVFSRAAEARHPGAGAFPDPAQGVADLAQVMPRQRGILAHQRDVRGN
jgi:hypothetical protein